MRSGSGSGSVEMRGIDVRFPGVLANDQVDLTVYKGEVHALLGENGAGKSTLMGVLAGLVHAERGEVRLSGKRVRIDSPRTAMALGIGMVHQHFMLVPTLTVAENVVLAQEKSSLWGRFWVSPQASEKRVKELAEKHKLSVDPSALVWQLSVGQQQRVEILKVLARGAEVLILDEPTAVLSPPEARALCVTLRELAHSGKTVILIGHKLREILSVADRCTVLRKGKVVAEGLETGGLREEDLSRMMVGASLTDALNLEREKPPAGVTAPPALELREVEVMGDRGLPELKGVTLTVHAGEIVGIAGVSGNGQRGLVELAAGLRRALRGQVLVGGKDMARCATSAFVEAGVAYVPEDRGTEGSVARLDLADNLLLKSYRKPPFRRGILLDRKAALRHAEAVLSTHQIAAPSPKAGAGTLSGGNLQRLILARELGANPRLIVAAQPTRGLDVAATHRVHLALVSARDRGAGVLVVSEDLEEVLSLSDRVVVLYGGRIAGTVSRDKLDAEEIGLMMVGQGR